jgi:hypothetical protein
MFGIGRPILGNYCEERQVLCQILETRLQCPESLLEMIIQLHVLSSGHKYCRYDGRTSGSSVSVEMKAEEPSAGSGLTRA